VAPAAARLTDSRLGGKLRVLEKSSSSHNRAISLSRPDFRFSAKRVETQNPSVEIVYVVRFCERSA
jgi:hypothetical protein